MERTLLISAPHAALLEYQRLRALRRKLVMERRELQSKGRRAREDKPKKVRPCTTP
jgi:hypothetical protein